MIILFQFYFYSLFTCFSIHLIILFRVILLIIYQSSLVHFLYILLFLICSELLVISLIFTLSILIMSPPRTSSFSFISIFRMRVVMSSANCCHKVTFFHIRIFTTTWSSKYKDLIIIRHSKCHLEHSYLKRFSLPYQNSVSQFLFFSFFLSLFFNGRSALKMNES